LRELAKKLHPDVNRNDPHAAALFAELNADHEIFSDEVKRHAFDRRKIAAERRPSRQPPACHALVPLCDWCGMLALGGFTECGHPTGLVGARAFTKQLTGGMAIPKP